MAIQAQNAPRAASSGSTVRLPSVAAIATAIGSRAASFVVFCVVAAFFLGSGAAGLIYQVAWVKILSLIFGVTIHAVSAVLSGFMLGLAVGSYLVGKLGDRIKHPLVTYGLIEIGIGVSALLTPSAFNWLRDSYPAIHGWSVGVANSLAVIGPASGIVTWLPEVTRLFLAFGILFVPTVLMGATLPVIVKAGLVQGGALGRSVSVLYAINTAGAIVGTVGAGFFLIGEAGVLGSIHVAATINIVIGLAALLLALVVNMLESGKTSGISQSAVFVAFGLSGLFGLAYEVIWFRLLSMFFENLTYSFTIMLASVLFGIAVGSYVLMPLLGFARRWINWWIVFAALQFAIGLCAVLSMSVLSNIDAAVSFLSGFEQLAFIQQWEDAKIILAAVAAISPAMFFSGMTFAVATLLYVGDSERHGRQVGTLYAANLIGSIAGSLVAGFYLLPVLSSQRSLVLLATGSVLMGALVLWLAPRASTHWLFKLGLTVLGGVAFYGVVARAPDLVQNVLDARFPGHEVLYYREGLESSVTVVKNPADNYITLYTNSRGQARDEPGLVAFHRLLGHMPALVHPNPTKALIVGIGGGATAGALAMYPGMQVDAVELSDAVIEAQGFFAHTNYAFFTLPNVKVRQNDARNFLSLTTTKYDIVSGDAIRPNDAGSATLYSLEYYRTVANALSENGVMTQWLPPFSEYQYSMVLRTFLKAFPYVTLWQSGDLAIGSKSPIIIDQAAVTARMADPRVKPFLDEAGITSPADFLSRFNAATEELRARVGDGPIITDDRPYIEYFRQLPKDGPPTMNYSRDIRPILKPAPSPTPVRR